MNGLCPICARGEAQAIEPVREEAVLEDAVLEDAVLAASDPFDPSGQLYKLYRCRNCGVIYLRGGDATYGAEYFGVDRLKKFSPFLAMRLAKMRSILRSGKILDYGCGSGECARYLRERGGYDAWGYDPNLAIPTDGETDFLTRDWDRILREKPYDLIMFWQSLEHLDQPLDVLRKAVGALSPGGMIFVSAPDFGSAQAHDGGSQWFHLDLPRHRWHFDKLTLEAYLRCAGLQPLRWFQRSWEYDPAGWLGTWWNQMLPRRNAFYMAWKGSGVRDVSFIVSALSLPFMAPLAFLRTILPGGGAILEVMARRIECDRAEAAIVIMTSPVISSEARNL